MVLASELGAMIFLILYTHSGRLLVPSGSRMLVMQLGLKGLDFPTCECAPPFSSICLNKVNYSKKMKKWLMRVKCI